MELETITVQHGAAYMIINKADFDPATHKLYEEPKAGGKKSEAGEGKGAGAETGKAGGKKNEA